MNETIDLNAELQSALPAVLAKMRENIIDKMSREAESVAMDAVRVAVREWTVAELVPEIRAQLDAGKSGMVTQASTIAESLGKAIGEALAGQAKKTLAEGYVVKDIAEKLFRGY